MARGPIRGTWCKVFLVMYPGPRSSWKTWLSYLNGQFAVVKVNGKVRILCEEFGPSSPWMRRVEFMTRGDFEVLLENQRVRVNGRLEPVASRWLSDPQRREFLSGIMFVPNGKVPEGVYNLWKGFAVAPEEGEVKPFLDFIHAVICAGDQAVYAYVVAWLADAIQNPVRRPGTALVLRGGQGIGKSFFAETFGMLFGQHFIEVNNPRHLVGNFNSHLLDKLVVFADEGSFETKVAQSTLKNLVTAPTLSIEPKGVDVIQAKNLLRIIIAGNHERLVAAAGDERRYLVLDVSDVHREDHAYFQALAAWRDNGGLAALLHFLQHHNIEGINLRSVPRTNALLGMKLASLNGVDKWWYGRLYSGELAPGRGWTDFVPISELHDTFTAEAGFARGRATQTELGTWLHRMVPNLKRNRRTNGKTRPWGYSFPPLVECRANFEERMGQRVDWPDDEKKNG
ncbi:MAG: DUF5906 domain-containing protein [Magnetospirillum sp. WYHS-4]